MSVSFDWDFAEEPRAPRPPDGRGGLPDRWRRWLSWGAVVFILLVAGGLLTRAWVNDRLKAIEKVEAELRGIVELELKSIAEGDGELFRTRQDPADPRWQARQVARYIANPTGFVPAPGLASAERPSEIKKAHVFGRSGRVELVHWFQPLSHTLPLSHTPTLSSPLPFHATWFYRLDEEGVWYHVAPPDDYWGIPYSWHGSRLTIRATEIESQLLDPIALDLALLVSEGCRRLDCLAQTRYTLSFEDNLPPQIQGDRWTLPALFLTGFPEGEEARAAWEQALKLWLVEALVRTRVAHPERAERVIYRQFVVRLQAELGLIEPPLPDVQLLAQALVEDKAHTPQGLWEAEYDPDDHEGNRLLEAEVTALLQFIETQVGPERLFDLLRALRDDQLFYALATFYRLDTEDFQAGWSAYLAELTGVAAPAATPQASVQPLEPPPAPPPPPVPPGDQIAFICDGRIWVGNADGSNVVPLTAPIEDFNGLYWSPDGRWLLTTWLPRRGGEPSALYLLATAGSEGYLLTDDPRLAAWPVGWSPNGREAIYYAWYGARRRLPEVRAIDVHTGEARQLPGMPTWSPDGQHLTYVTEPDEGGTSVVWLADANWENVRQIVDQVGVWLWPGWNWSPDGSRLALALHDVELDEKTIAIYDLQTEEFSTVVTSRDIVAALLSSDGDFLSDGTALAALEGKQLSSLWVFGWSADGSHLLVWAQATTGNPAAPVPTVLAVVPVDGSSPRVLAYGQWGLFGPSAWSPAGPRRLTFTWPTPSGPSKSPHTYLFDLDAGAVYTATQSWNAAWSPDGAWVAFAGEGQVTVVDQAGRPRFALGHGGSCSDIAWNPAADLSALGTLPVLTSSAPGWGVANSHIYQDPETQVVHVWGELLNYTGRDRRITAFTPVVYDGDGNPLSDDRSVAFLTDYEDLLEAVSLADGRSLPFGFTVDLPEGVLVENDYQVAVGVTAMVAEPTRDDLDIPFHEFDLSEWPEAFQVRGTFENPGPDLTDYLMVVVTAYDLEGRVIGSGWRYETDPAYLATGTHNFEVTVELSEAVADQNLEVGAYKVQLFAH
jgi:Tol biopolymer transport system component